MLAGTSRGSLFAGHGIKNRLAATCPTLSTIAPGRRILGAAMLTGPPEHIVPPWVGARNPKRVTNADLLRGRTHAAAASRSAPSLPSSSRDATKILVLPSRRTVRTFPALIH